MYLKDKNTYYGSAYIDETNLSISDSIYEISQAVYANTYHQKFPAFFPHLLPKSKLLQRNKRQFNQKAKTPDDSVARKSHGSQHVSRVGIDAIIYFNVLVKYATPEYKEKINAYIQSLPEIEGMTKEELFAKCLQVAAVYHDAGRHGDGPDQPTWEDEGAGDCFKMITKLLMNSGIESEEAEKIALRFSLAAAQKDAPITLEVLKKKLERKLKCSGDDNIVEALNREENMYLRELYFLTRDQITVEKLNAYEKDFLRIPIQCADCVDIQRVPSKSKFVRNLFTTEYVFRPSTRHFEIQYLDLWQQTLTENGAILPNQRARLQYELIMMALTNRSLLDFQKDLHNAAPIEVRTEDGSLFVISRPVINHYDKKAKRSYEHGDNGQTGFEKVEADFHHFPLLSHFYNDGKLFSLSPEDNLSEIELTEVEQFLKPIQDLIDKLIIEHDKDGKLLTPLMLSFIALNYQFRLELERHENFESNKEFKYIRNKFKACMELVDPNPSEDNPFTQLSDDNKLEMMYEIHDELKNKLEQSYPNLWQAFLIFFQILKEKFQQLMSNTKSAPAA